MTKSVNIETASCVLMSVMGVCHGIESRQIGEPCFTDTALQLKGSDGFSV